MRRQQKARRFTRRALDHRQSPTETRAGVEHGPYRLCTLATVRVGLHARPATNGRAFHRYGILLQPMQLPGGHGSRHRAVGYGGHYLLKRLFTHVAGRIDAARRGAGVLARDDVAGLV